MRHEHSDRIVSETLRIRPVPVELTFPHETATKYIQSYFLSKLHNNLGKEKNKKCS